MRHDGEKYQIEDGVFGPRFVVTGEWHERFADHMVLHNIRELNINYARGFRGDNLEFLRSLTFLEGLLLIVYHIDDISPIHDLHNLKHLNLGTRDKTPLDFTNFPHLEDCGLDWRPKAKSLFQCRTLRRLWINKYSGHEVAEFAELQYLEHFFIASSPVHSIKSVGNLHSLHTLGLYYLNRLRSLDGIESLGHLENLDINTCRKIETIDQVGALHELRSLTVANCGDIASLKQIVGLSKLERVIFYQSTNIVDGDISPLVRTPPLNEVRFQNRRHYSHKCDIFAPWNQDNNQPLNASTRSKYNT